MLPFAANFHVEYTNENKKNKKILNGRDNHHFALWQKDLNQVEKPIVQIYQFLRMIVARDFNVINPTGRDLRVLPLPIESENRLAKSYISSSHNNL